jgi:hypothetical protein
MDNEFLARNEVAAAKPDKLAALHDAMATRIRGRVITNYL